jgi:hypothetical protein
LPRALSYTEIIPEEFHNLCLYDDKQELINKLVWALSNPIVTAKLTVPLAEAMQKFDWRHMASKYDDELSRLATN